jgi:hypothetical protein
MAEEIKVQGNVTLSEPDSFRMAFPEKWAANEQSMRDMLVKKWHVELAMAIITLAAIITASVFCLIDQCTTGTLMGVSIGYYLKGARKLHA